MPGYILLLAFVLVLAYGVSATSWLHVNYTHAMPIAPQASEVGEALDAGGG